MRYGSTLFLGDKYDLILGPMEQFDLDTLMNGPIRYKLEIIPEHVTWGGKDYPNKFTHEFTFANFRQRHER